MREIVFENPHRQKHFDFFNSMNHPHFNITANVDITNFFKFAKEENLPLTPAIVFFIAKAAHAIPQFRWRVRGNKVFEHEQVRPSFSVFTEVADVFSFCTVKFENNGRRFVQHAFEKSEQMRKDPSFEDEPGQDDYLFLSAIPWVSFTGFQHAMQDHPSDSVPRITWGKFFEQDGKTQMPLSVQVHHAVVDGRHVGHYFQLLEKMMGNPRGYF